MGQNRKWWAPEAMRTVTLQRDDPFMRAPIDTVAVTVYRAVLLIARFSVTVAGQKSEKIVRGCE